MHNRELVLSNAITYLISFCVVLFLKVVLDNLFGNSIASSWVLVLSIPFFGLIRIVSKDTIFHWAKDFLDYLGLQTTWNFKKVSVLATFVINLIFLVASLPFTALYLIIISAKIIARWAFQVLILYVIGGILGWFIFWWLLPNKFSINIQPYDFWYMVLTTYLWIWIITMPILSAISFLSQEIPEIEDIKHQWYQNDK